jgi:choline dehydrogenase-like flavoprotein
MKKPTRYDVAIIGAGVSGSFVAYALIQKELSVCIVEAGKNYQNSEYPDNEIDANSQLYWSGGIELNRSATIGFLRPKAVGGGSVVNQALVDRFDEIALESWRKSSGISTLSTENLAPYYTQAESLISIQTIPAEYRNGNAKIFERGFQANGFICAPLRRAQKDCKYNEGNDCIECLAGCKIRSKQSTGDTILKIAKESGRLEILSETEVIGFSEKPDHVILQTHGPKPLIIQANRLVLAAGAIGNSALLLRSGYGSLLPAVGQRFFTHPQYMTLAEYKEPIHAEKGPFQALKSNDPHFRELGFKLENVFAPPVSIATLIPGIGRKHLEAMKKITYYACIEVAVRDTNPGQIRLGSGGRIQIIKELNATDERRKQAGLNAVNAIFKSTGAVKIIPGSFGIGLHLMGGCPIGSDSRTSVINPDFQLYGSKRIYAADSSIFPDAPGINPSLTIMALSLMASERIAP